MSMKDIASQEAKNAAEKFLHGIADGTIKKRILPNSGSHFDEEKAFNSFKSSCKNDIIKGVAKKIYE